MTTLHEAARDTITQVRDDIAPGASGWDNESEAGALNTLLAAAQLTIGLDIEFDDAGLAGIRDEIIGRVTRELSPGHSGVGVGRRSIERAAAPGQINAALIKVEADLIEIAGP